MFGLFSKKDQAAAKVEDATTAAARKSRICEIGWLVDVNKAAFIYGAPRQLTRKAAEAQAATRAKGEAGVASGPVTAARPMGEAHPPGGNVNVLGHRRKT